MLKTQNQIILLKFLNPQRVLIFANGITSMAAVVSPNISSVGYADLSGAQTG